MVNFNCVYEHKSCFAAHASRHNGFAWIAFCTRCLLLTGFMQRIASLAKTNSFATFIDVISLHNQINKNKNKCKKRKQKQV